MIISVGAALVLAFSSPGDYDYESSQMAEYSVLKGNFFSQNPDHFDDFDVFFGQNLAKWLV
jgi:hypothetical protein